MAPWHSTSTAHVPNGVCGPPAKWRLTGTPAPTRSPPSSWRTRRPTYPVSVQVVKEYLTCSQQRKPTRAMSPSNSTCVDRSPHATARQTTRHTAEGTATGGKERRGAVRIYYRQKAGRRTSIRSKMVLSSSVIFEVVLLWFYAFSPLCTHVAHPVWEPDVAPVPVVAIGRVLRSQLEQKPPCPLYVISRSCNVASRKTC